MPNTSFTPQEIEQFLQQFFDVVGARQYIGARYVPIFGRAGSDTVEWDDLAPYEPLTVVMHDGVSYVSRRYVPAGIEITNTDYWVETYRYNAQVEQYRQEVLSFQGQIDEIYEDLVPFPDPQSYPKYGLAGQVLATLANGGTRWTDPVVPSDEQAEEVITAWLDDHPEATTTVQDNSVTDAKLVQQGGILSTVGSFVHRQNSASRVMTVPISVAAGDVLYFKPLVWTGVSFTAITVSGVISEGQYAFLGRVTALNQEKYITVSNSYSSLVVNVGVPSVPSSPVAFQFILCNISDLDNLASYVMDNRNVAASLDTRVDAIEPQLTASFKYRGFVDANGNINNLQDAGWYLIASARIPTITGLPDSIKTDGLLVVYPGGISLQYIYELSYPYDSYQRYLYGEGANQSRWMRHPAAARAKTLYLFGDSITKGTIGGTGTVGLSYLELYGDKQGYDVVNCGIGGIGYVYSAAKSTSEVPWNTGGGRIRAQDVLNHYASELQTANPDTIIMAYGINDWQTLGDPSVTITEADRRATSANIEANVKTAISTILTASPNSRLIVVTPINTSYRGGSRATGFALETELTNNNDGLEAMTLEKVFTAIVNACEYYGVKYVDMTHSNSIVNYLNINNVLPDKLHPSQGTYYRLSDDLASRFR